MSKLNVSTIQSPSNVLRVQEPNVLYAPGHIVRVYHSTVMARAYYSIPNNDGGMRGDVFAEGINQGGTIIRPLDITVTPSTVDSWIHVEFNVFYEAHQDMVFSVLRDGQLIGASWQGGDVSTYWQTGKWNGAGVSRYDNNNDSTPGYINLPWIDRPGTTDPVTYSFAVKSAGTSNFDFILNATYTNYENGSDAYEQGVSFTIAQEIAN